MKIAEINKEKLNKIIEEVNITDVYDLNDEEFEDKFKEDEKDFKKYLKKKPEVTKKILDFYWKTKLVREIEQILEKLKIKDVKYSTDEYFRNIYFKELKVGFIFLDDWSDTLYYDAKKEEAQREMITFYYISKKNYTEHRNEIIKLMLNLLGIWDV